MSIVIENTSLEELVREYFSDQAALLRYEDINTRRAQQIPLLRALTEQFIGGKSNLSNFRDQLQSVLKRNEVRWGTSGPGFMMELNKLIKHHDEHAPIAEKELRQVLAGMNRDNLGERIETFYNFLLNERGRLHREGKTSFQAMAPGNTAFMLSLFAYWLNSECPPVIYFPRTCMVVSLLMSSGILPDPGNLHTVYDANNKTRTILVRNNSEHLAFQQAVRPLLHFTVFENTPGVIEYFFSWIGARFIDKNDEPPTTLIQQIDNADTLIKPVPDTPAVKESIPPYDMPGPQVADTPQHEKVQFKNEKLKAVPEPLLTQLIAEVQRFILVDEAVVRQIYHALLAGHVILTGPPGTGKTELASIIPEILWKSEAQTDDNSVIETNELTTATAYATNLVTATDEWSVRTLISGIVPQSKDGRVTYTIQYGFLTNAIRKNWSTQSDDPHDWGLNLQRTPIQASSKIERSSLLPFRGQWLVIDEFNRAPIDLALGDALTALGGNDVLRVAIEGGSAELPIPQDFRIIGTLNSFDRSYLNQISEALKRRFSFIEILPPSRAQREAEQGIVLFKAPAASAI
jgi:AAA domain (dynein-related subfamily)